MMRALFITSFLNFFLHTASFSHITQSFYRLDRSSSSTSSSISVSISDLSEARTLISEEFLADENNRLMMEAIRGQNLNDDDFASSSVKMNLAEEFTFSSSNNDNDDNSPLKQTYDPEFLAAYFSPKPLTVGKRIFQIATTFASFWSCTLADIAIDKFTNRDDPNGKREIKRAIKLREAITSLGPFYIKLGQALSIRPDLLSPRSMVELQKLCDKVPSFPSSIAFDTIRRELEISNLDEVYSSISDQPVAAASLGQVYKATLKTTGDTVAVKVQRPGVLETVSLDLYLFRTFGTLLASLPNGISSRLDIVGLLDEFAFRFYQELDYVNECKNGEIIREQMKVLPKVLIPKNYPTFTSRKVHTAEWVDGEKLSQSNADDVGALVNLGVITYLTQLLEFGFFHADPHPGNMLRSPDGRLCILDFGLMTEVTEGQQFGMVEAIVHLLQRDYEYIGEDFVNLGFIPPGTDTTPIIPALTQVFDAALSGGGAKSINFGELSNSLAEITFKFPFKIPPYFALIIRAISVLEGIALVGNPEFAIIDEAFPYIARRLLTADSPRLKEALRYLVYGKDGLFDAATLIDVLQALEKFTAVKDDGDGSAFKKKNVRGSKNLDDLTSSTTGRRAVDTSSLAGTRFEKATLSSTGATISGNDKTAARSALKFFFSKDGSFFRDFLQEEITTVVDSASRELLFTLGKRFGIDPQTTLPKEMTSLPGYELLLPGFGLLRAINPPLSDKDKRNLEEITTLLSFLTEDGNGNGNDLRNNDAGKIFKFISEFQQEAREFVTVILLRLTERRISRGLKFLAGDT